MAKKNNALLVTEGSYVNGDTELRKHNDAVSLRVVKGNLSLYDRRAFNAACAHAQRQGAPGINAPLDSPASKSYFWFRYTDVSKDIGGSREAIKEAFETLADVEVVAESDREWTSERMISGVKFFNSHGLKNKGGTLWIGISFPPEVQEMVLRPSTYTKFSLLYQTILTKNHSMGLYEILRRYATSPAHLTVRAPVAWWYSVITGNPITDPQPLYKYMKRDTFMPSLRECNDVTDIVASMIEFKKGRSVAELQYTVHLKNQTLLPLESLPVFDVSLLARVMKLGLSQDEAKSSYSTYGEPLLTVTVEYVEARLKSKKGTTLASPAAYFKTALKDGYAKEMLNKPTPAAKPKAGNGRDELRERFIAARSVEAMGYYDELDEIERKKLLDEFLPEVSPTIRKYIKKSGLEMMFVRSVFGEWIANKVWGVPTDAMILDFLAAEEVDTDSKTQE